MQLHSRKQTGNPIYSQYPTTTVTGLCQVFFDKNTNLMIPLHCQLWLFIARCLHVLGQVLYLLKKLNKSLKCCSLSTADQQLQEQSSVCLLSVAVCCGGGLFLATQKIQTYSLSPGLGVAIDLFHRSHQKALITTDRCLYPVTSRRKDLYLTSNRVRNLFAPHAHLLYRSPSAPFHSLPSAVLSQGWLSVLAFYCWQFCFL